MAPPRRPAAPAAPPPVATGVNFGDDAFYVGGGFNLPEDDYALVFDTRMHTPTKQDGTVSGQPFLAVGLTAYSLTKPGEVHEAILSMGGKAHLSFQPDPNTGKGLVAVPGGPAQTMNDKTNWNIFRRSMLDCGLPPGVLTNDFSVIDGIHVHIQNIPEPEERKAFRSQAQTGDVQEEQKNRGPKLIPVVSEIKEDGKPWEGTGGVPDQTAPAPAAKTGPKGVVKPAAVARPAVARPAPVQAPLAAATDDEAIHTAAVNGAAAVLGNSPLGVTKVLLRTGTFKAVKDAEGEEVVQQVMAAYFGSDEHLNTLLGELGYTIQGSGPTAKVVPVQ